MRFHNPHTILHKLHQCTRLLAVHISMFALACRRTCTHTRTHARTHAYTHTLPCMCKVIFSCRNSIGVPIFEKPPEKYSAHRIMQILLNSKIDERRIAMKRPLEAPFSSTFIVDVSKLAHPDVKKDMYGKWLYSGSHSDVFLCSYSVVSPSNRLRRFIEKSEVLYVTAFHHVINGSSISGKFLKLSREVRRSQHKLR